jgi:pyruvate dehydrogenase (quinone)
LPTLPSRHCGPRASGAPIGSMAFVELEMKAVGIVKHDGSRQPKLRLRPASDQAARRAVGRPDEIEAAAGDAFVHDGPTVIDIITARQKLSMPPRLTFEQIKGFTVYASRTILSGPAVEIVEPAKTNLRDLGVE